MSAPNLLAADLRQVLDAFRREGELLTIPNADCELELGAIAELQALRHGPALMFDPLPGFPAGFRILANLMNEPRRVALLMGLERDVPGVVLVRAIRDRFNALQPIDPVQAGDAGFAEVCLRGAEVDLCSLPAPLWHEHDGGRYLGTGCVVVMKDPDEGWVNVGTYRVQVHDARTAGLFIEQTHHGATILRRWWERGQAAPIAVCIGVQPAVLLGGFLAVSWGLSEYRWAGGLAGRPIEIVEGEVTGLPLPASSEIVIEGFCPPPSEERRMEGPFGETIGYYASGAREEPVIRVETMYHRRDPIVVGAPPLRPPASSSASYLFRAANLWNEIERSGVSDVRGVWMMPSGSSSLLAVVSVKQRYGGHAKHVGTAAMSGRAGGGQLGRFVIVVDDDVDPSDQEQVLWAIATRCEPAEDIDVIRGTASHHLDPRLPPEKRAAGDYTCSRAVINACRPFYWRSQFPEVVGTSPELRQQILAKWRDYF
ncbi:MAG TPA: UbiD family decarboxylase [Chloroflexota bacterium]|nr:UbiD family decarboxylase [Chloroflexota bacterium]